MAGGPDALYAARPCDQIFDTLGRSRADTLSRYPDCKPFLDGTNLRQYAAVVADMSDSGDGINAGVALGVSFGAAAWLALAVHAIGIEIYVSSLFFTHFYLVYSLFLFFFFFHFFPPS